MTPAQWIGLSLIAWSVLAMALGVLIGRFLHRNDTRPGARPEVRVSFAVEDAARIHLAQRERVVQARIRVIARRLDRAHGGVVHARPSV